MRLADSIGPELYGWINHDLPHIAFAGEWLFTEALYGADAERDAHFIDEVLGAEWHVPEHQVQALLGVRARIEDFMQAAFAAVDWRAAQVVGFTSTFEQNIASLALARRVKAAHPHICIAFGGANSCLVMRGVA